MNIKKVIGLEHDFNGHSKFKLITYLAEKKGFMGLTTTSIKKRILYVFDPETNKKGDAKMFTVNNDKEVEQELTNTEYNIVAKFVQQYTTAQEANKTKEVTK